MTLEFTIKDKKFISLDRAAQVYELLETDGKYEIKKVTKKRTLNQNAYMHYLFSTIAKDTGEEDVEYIKHHFKSKYLKKYSTKKNIEYIWSTAKLNTVEIWEFIDKILNDMAKIGYTYQTPEQWRNWAKF